MARAFEPLLAHGVRKGHGQRLVGAQVVARIADARVTEWGVSSRRRQAMEAGLESAQRDLLRAVVATRAWRAAASAILEDMRGRLGGACVWGTPDLVAHAVK